MMDESKMTMDKVLVRLLQTATAICLLFVATAASALEVALSAETVSVLDYLTDKNGKYTGPTLEENVVKMDTDKNGFADVFEVRAFLALMHGKDYEKEMLDKWEASASGKSCSTPFAKDLVTDITY